VHYEVTETDEQALPDMQETYSSEGHHQQAEKSFRHSPDEPWKHEPHKTARRASRSWQPRALQQAAKAEDDWEEDDEED
jgi:hypothetical protein